MNINIESTIQNKLNDIIRERFSWINKTFELLNNELINFSNKSEKNIEEIRNNTVITLITVSVNKLLQKLY